MSLDFEQGQHPKGFINILLGIVCLSILTGSYAEAWREYSFAIWTGFAVAAVAMLWLLHKGSRYAWLAVSIVIFLLGLGRYYAASDIKATDISLHEGKSIRIEGTIDGSPRFGRDEAGKLKLRYVLNAENIVQKGERKSASGKIIAYANATSLDTRSIALLLDDSDNVRAALSREQELLLGQSGDKISLSGTVRKIHDYGNPGRMNIAANYLAQGISCQLMADKFSIRIKPREADWLTRTAAKVRSHYKASLEDSMDSQASAAIFAMLFGGYQGIKPELLEAFTTVGLVHILSVSGSHITLMAGAAGIIGRLLHLSARLTAILSAAAILFYGLLAGAIPPVVRSVIMGLLTVCALTLSRDKDAQYALGLTTIAMLFYAPLWLFDISFQLSCGAAAGLLYIAPPLRVYMREKMPVFVADSLAVTIGAQVSVIPVIAWYFNVISLSSLLANLIVAPLIEWIIVVGLLAGLIGGLVPMLGKLIFMLTGIALGLAYEMTRKIAALPGSKIYMPSLGWVSTAVYYMMLGFCLLPLELRQKARQRLCSVLADCKGIWYKQAKQKKITVWIFVFIAAIGIAWQVCFAPKDLQVHFIDVGQGDAALVVTPHGHAFMVDAGGTRAGSYDIGKMVDVPYLLHYGVRSLDYIFLTHVHDDHAAGVKGIISKMPVKNIMIGHEGSDAYLQVFGTGENKRLEKKLIPLQENTLIELDGVKIEILYSPEQQKVIEQSAATGNEYSNLIRVSYGRASFLFTGDLTKEQEKIVLANGSNVQSTVLKVGHHGSKTSSSEEFLCAVKPQWAIISCGYINSFGHPHKEILQRLSNATQAKILRTDQQGAITFRTDGEKISVSCYKNF